MRCNGVAPSAQRGSPGHPAELLTHDPYNSHISEPISASAHYDLVSLIVHVAVNRPAMPAWAVVPCGADPISVVPMVTVMMVVAGVKPGSGMTRMTRLARMTRMTRMTRLARMTGVTRPRPHCARWSCDHYQRNQHGQISQQRFHDCPLLLVISGIVRSC